MCVWGGGGVAYSESSTRSEGCGQSAGRFHVNTRRDGDACTHAPHGRTHGPMTKRPTIRPSVHAFISNDSHDSTHQWSHGSRWPIGLGLWAGRAILSATVRVAHNMDHTRAAPHAMPKPSHCDTQHKPRQGLGRRSLSSRAARTASAARRRSSSHWPPVHRHASRHTGARAGFPLR